MGGWMMLANTHLTAGGHEQGVGIGDSLMPVGWWRAEEHPHSHPTGLFHYQLSQSGLGYEPTASRQSLLQVKPFRSCLLSHITQLCPDRNWTRLITAVIQYGKFYLVVKIHYCLLPSCSKVWIKPNISWLEPFFNSCWRALTHLWHWTKQ